PPLRERPGDLPLLVDHFLKRFNRELGKEVQCAAPESLAVFKRYSWPSNVRELRSVLKQTMLLASGPVLPPNFLPPLAEKDDGAGCGMAPGTFRAWDQFIHARSQAGSQRLYAETLGIMERLLLTKVLRHTAGNQVQAAKILGITRGSLRTKIRTLQIKI